MEYTTADGAKVSTGDDAFSHYLMAVGTIGRDIGGGWFKFEHGNGSESLDGSRVCTLAHAQRMGWPIGEPED